MASGMQRTLLSLAIGLIPIAALIWSFWPRPVSVDLASVTRGPMRVEVSDEGRTRVREIYQLSAPVSGRLLRIEVHPGDKVVGNTTRVAELLPISPSFLDVRNRTQAEAAVKSAEAARRLAASEVDRAKAELAYAASDLKRASTLARSDAIPKANLDRAQLTYNTALTQLRTSQAALNAKGFDLDAAKALLIDPVPSMGQRSKNGVPIVAPVSGQVLRVLHENEAVLAAGAPILEIGDLRNLEIVAEMISEDAVKVHPGDRATITDWGGSGPLDARVRLVEPSGFTKVSALGVEEQRVNVLLDLTDPPSLWKSIADGYRVVVHIAIWGNAKVLRVPISAMFRYGNGWAVFAARNGRAVRTVITVGHSNGEVAAVTSGLHDGDRVIVHPSDRIADGVAIAGRAPQG